MCDDDDDDDDDVDVDDEDDDDDDDDDALNTDSEQCVLRPLCRDVINTILKIIQTVETQCAVTVYK